MKRMRVLLSLLVFGVSATPAWAQFSDATLRHANIALFPSVPSTRDTLHVGYIATCGEEWSQPAPLQYTRERGWVLTHQTTLSICGVPPGDGKRLNLVRLPDDLNDTGLTLLSDVPLHDPERHFEIRRIDRIPPSAAGTWYDPAHSGQGIYLAHSPLPAGPPLEWGAPFHYDGFTLVWATFGPEGRPLWLVGNSSTVSFVIRMNMFEARSGAFPTRAGAAEPVRPWGRVTLEYLGCGRMSMRWEALDATAFPAGDLQLSQLTSDASHPCDPLRYAREKNMRPVIVPVKLLSPESPR